MQYKGARPSDCIASLFYFSKNYTIVIEIILFTMSIMSIMSVKSKLATTLTRSIYTEGPFKIYIKINI